MSAWEALRTFYFNSGGVLGSKYPQRTVYVNPGRGPGEKAQLRGPRTVYVNQIGV